LDLCGGAARLDYFGGLGKKAGLGMSTNREKRKPFLRGILHVVGAIAAVPAVAVLVARAAAGPATVASAIYGVSLVLLLAISAVYHTPTWSPKRRALLRRLDHSAIFLLIAGTYTPICFVKLEPKIGAVFFWSVWALAAIGVFTAILWPKRPRAFQVGFYVAFGLFVLPFGATFFGSLDVTTIVLIATGGAVYAFGALAYGLRWPDPFPSVFGYHEILHACVVGAGALHFIAIWGIVVLA